MMKMKNQKWKGRRSRSTKFKYLSGEHRSDEEESRAEGKKNKGRRSNTGIGKVNGGTQVPCGFFSTSAATTCNSSFKNLISILELEF